MVTKKIFITLVFIVCWIELGVKSNGLRVLNTFTEERLMYTIKRLGIVYPEIVFAQARLETGNFKSKVFKQNNNLFGMKLAKQRRTTALGEANSHALYSDWIKSVEDYKIWQKRILKKTNTRKEYLNYLSKYYAENKQYVKLIKQMI